MSRNVQECPGMSRNVQECPGMSRNVRECMVIPRKVCNKNLDGKMSSIIKTTPSLCCNFESIVYFYADFTYIITQSLSNLCLLVDHEV